MLSFDITFMSTLGKRQNEYISSHCWSSHKWCNWIKKIFQGINWLQGRNEINQFLQKSKSSLLRLLCVKSSQKIHQWCIRLINLKHHEITIANIIPVIFRTMSYLHLSMFLIFGKYSNECENAIFSSSSKFVIMQHSKFENRFIHANWSFLCVLSYHPVR